MGTRCEYFVILCPELMHFDVGHLLGQERLRV